jgi:sec-independent protein translocase protein TatA
MMGSLSIWHWLILAVVVAVLFGGRGKLSSVMGDAAKGIRAFKEGLKDEQVTHQETPPPPGALPNESTLERQAADKK